ncbi:DUF3110 domain-containing protein [Brasilonema sp. UFV-L1]|uniref:DUF3110 domain-containing protein n=1 Tax=Brasilonema sp. UFV-L1 TaxID=2234130 RepID=UPI00145DAC65|nr:DUF3110 domain-containing protein [Brasilonema sp. UFV-L1]NMG09467.1 DUF3110 domain-containing protein [Brasilonema sp. UFV-L1]
MITPMRVFVLLFNARTENEGIHSIRVGDRNKVLMFESEDDATRFALMLEAQDFPTPTVEAIDSEEVKEFCQGVGYDWEIVPNESALAIPPENNVEETDWKLDSEKDVAEEILPPNQKSEEKSELSDSELDSIRRKLEGLM